MRACRLISSVSMPILRARKEANMGAFLGGEADSRGRREVSCSEVEGGGEGGAEVMLEEGGGGGEAYDREES